MLKFVLCLFAGLIAYTVPAHAALSQVNGFYVKRSMGDIITVCTREANLERCYTLVTRKPDAEGLCSAPTMRNLIAMTKAEVASDPIPPEGFLTVEKLSRYIRNNAAYTMSGEIFPCGNSTEALFEGAFCADTILRDGAYVFDHCVMAMGPVTLTPAPDEPTELTVTGISANHVNVCESLESGDEMCVRLEAEPQGVSSCQTVPALIWQPFGSLLNVMQAAFKKGEAVYIGAAPCNAEGRIATACILKNANSTKWQACSVVRILPLTEEPE